MVEIMAVWQPGEGRDTKGLPSRGFAGQLFFFKQGNPSPSEITGDVKIYVFDDQGTEEEIAKPIHVYEFKEGAWNAYLTKTNIGQAYQIFIPYPRKGDHRAICSLRIKHIAPSGEILLSDPADIVLAGRKVPANVETTVSTSRPAVPSGLATQQTHVATINRSGKVESTRPGTEQPLPSELTTSSLQKNTQTAHYQQLPQGALNPPVENAARQDGPARTPSEIELVGWSLHAEPQATRSAPPANPVSRQTPPSRAEPHPLATVAPNSTKPRPIEETRELLFEHPLAAEEIVPKTKQSGLKVRNITLE